MQKLLRNGLSTYSLGGSTYFPRYLSPLVADEKVGSPLTKSRSLVDLWPWSKRSSNFVRCMLTRQPGNMLLEVDISTVVLRRVISLLSTFNCAHMLRADITCAIYQIYGRRKAQHLSQILMCKYIGFIKEEYLCLKPFNVLQVATKNIRAVIHVGISR